MLGVLFTLTPGHLNEFIDCQKAKVHTAVLPIMDVKTRGNSTLELLEQAYPLGEFSRQWLQHPKYSDYQPLFATQDKWTIVKYIMGDSRPFRSLTLWMSKRHTVTLHHDIKVYTEMVDRMDGVMRALAKKKTQWKENLFFTVKLAQQKRYIY